MSNFNHLIDHCKKNDWEFLEVIGFEVLRNMNCITILSLEKLNEIDMIKTLK